MCRLMFIIGAKETDKVLPFMKKAKTHLSKQNTDGLGYTAIKGDGNIFTERWLKNYEAFDKRLTDKDEEMLGKLGSFLDVESSSQPYTQQGTVDWSDVKSVMMHTRFATCGKGIDNVHPFVDNDNEVAIVHNGVINNHNTFSKLNSTCDSEVLLTEYMNREIRYDVTKIEELSNELKGYWAVGTTAKDYDGNRYIDIYRSNASATLFGLYVEQLGGMVFSTRDQIIKDTMKDMGWEQHNTIFEVNPYVAVRFDAITGDVMESYEWEHSPVVNEPVTYVEPVVHGKWNNITRKWERKEPLQLVDDNKKTDKTVIVESEFIKEYDNVYEQMDKHYTFVDVDTEDIINEQLDEELLELLSTVEDDLTKSEYEELCNLPYDMIPEFIQGIVDRKKKEA